MRLTITEFLTAMGSPKKSPTSAMVRATTMIEKKSPANNLTQSSERRDRADRAQQNVVSSISRGVLIQQVRDCDPVVLTQFSDETYNQVKQELRDELETEITKTTTQSQTTQRNQDTIRKLQQTTDKNRQTIQEDGRERQDKIVPYRNEIQKLLE